MRPADCAYWSVTSHAGTENPRIRAFLGWLEREVERDAQSDADAARRQP